MDYSYPLHKTETPPGQEPQTDDVRPFPQETPLPEEPEDYQQSYGYLEVNVTSFVDNHPLNRAVVRVTDINNPSVVLGETVTDENGVSDPIPLPAPPIAYSMDPSAARPYTTYRVEIEEDGYEPIIFDGSQILPETVAIQNVTMIPAPETPVPEGELCVIPDQTLYGTFPPKIPEDEIKPTNESGEIVLSRVVIPEFVVVHDGPPNDPSAQNYYVRYKDYIKNVASCEIYATWPEETIKANVMAIQSFTLNRVYTEWYRNKGYDFTITSSTAYDHKWVPGKTIYDTIDLIVDNIFADYLSRPGVTQPILTQYCDGERVTCPNWMSQWGSKYLGDQGYSAIEILRYYYGDSIYANYTDSISGVPASWPRENLSVGSVGQKVEQMQEQLAVISRSYPAIPTIDADGIFGSRTEEAVREFQRVFRLPETGVVDYTTWYKISEIYLAVSRIAELY